MTLCLVAIAFAALFESSNAAFVTQGNMVSTPFLRQSASTSQQLHLFDPSIFDQSSIAATANNMWLATIDADIDAIPDNEFGKVFAGGIVVMCGGVLSALVVGFILERGDLYADVAAESYLQSAEDEEFWKGLSEEEKKKTEGMLKKIRDSKEVGSSPTPVVATEVSSMTKAEPSTTVEAPKKSETAAKPTDMFSDYGE